MKQPGAQSFELKFPLKWENNFVKLEKGFFFSAWFMK